MLFFPHPLTVEGDGLLAYGGDLSIERLLLAYQFGIFPWYNQLPILWWYTSPRLVLFPHALHIAKSMRPYLNNDRFRLSIDRCFEEVIEACAASPRGGQSGTWITLEMKQAYTSLNELKIAHSIEVWQGDQLVGGLYGIVRGKIFYGESMFTTVANASKFAFIQLVKILERKGFVLIDCQQDTDYMRNFGADLISKEQFYLHLKNNLLKDHLVLEDHDIPLSIRYITG